MHLPSFLPGRAGDQQHYARLGRSKMVLEDGDVFDWDRQVLICKAQGDESEEPAAASPKTPRFRAFPSPRRPAREPGHGTMTLLIRRIDDTTFAVAVPKKATLLDLKETVRLKFESDGNQISWPHVWRHFCLSFRGQKLLEDDLVLYKLGVRDLDELIFMRHLDTRPNKGSWTGSFFSSLRWKHKLTV